MPPPACGSPVLGAILRRTGPDRRGTSAASSRRRVQVGAVGHVVARDEEHELAVCPKVRSRASIADRRLDDAGPMIAAEHHRMPHFAGVRRGRQRRRGGLRGESQDRRRGDAGRVHQQDRGRVDGAATCTVAGSECAEAGPEGGAMPVSQSSLMTTIARPRSA